MENKEILRDSICLGNVALIKRGEVIQKNLRSMLFYTNLYGFASDLLFKTEEYPVLNKQELEKIKNVGFAVEKVKNISELFRWYGCKEYMSYEEVHEIFKKIYKPEYLVENADLFGYQEVKPSEFTYIKNGRKITDVSELLSLDIEDVICFYQEKFFFHSGNSYRVLSNETWDALRNLDTFYPSTYEGKIPQRIRF